MNTLAQHLMFHGSIVLLYGLLCGAPYARAINRHAPAHVVHSWRVAHASLPIGATLMLVVAALLPVLPNIAALKWTIALALIVSSYAFVVALTLAPIVGHRGLSSQGPVAAKLVFAGNFIGALASIVAAVALVFATYLAL